jgi:hypothetical protein
LGAKIGSAERKDLPTDLGVEQRLGATPWGSSLAKDPRAVKHGMTVRDDRQTQLNEIDQYNTDLKGAEAFKVKYDTGMAEEQVAATNAPAALGRKKDEYNAMTPLEVNRAGMVTGAQQAAQLPYEMAMQRRRHLDQVEQARIGREAEVHALPPSIAQAVSSIDTSLYSLDKMEALFNTGGVDEQIGPVAGRMGKLQQKFPLLPTDPEFNTFVAETATFQNSVIKAITGAQMSEPEAKRIMRQIPTENDKPDVWKAKALATRQNLIMLRNEQIDNVNSVQDAMPIPTNNDKPLPEDPATAAAVQKFREMKKRRGMF